MVKRRRPPRLSPDDVLAGRVRPSARDLARLIRDTNPTGLDLAPREMQRRYAHKTKLQSLLIRTYADDVVAVAAGPADGIAFLRHRNGSFEACHVVVQELDDDARSIVQRMLDVATEATDEDPPGTDTASPSSHDGGVEALILEGRRAAADYDFEVARERLGEAVRRSGGGAKAGTALLELLVEQVGLFDEALELEGRFSEEAMGQGVVCSLLAKAAAYLGARERALALIGPFRNARTAEAHALLARQAIGAGLLDVAMDDYRQCAEHDPASPDLEELRGPLERLDEQERTAAQALAESLTGSEDLTELQRAVSALLLRWPDDPVGTRLKGVVDERRARIAMLDHESRAEALARAQDWEGALSAIRRAMACGASKQQWAERIAAWESRLALAKDRLRFARAAEALRTAPNEQAVAAYLECPAPMREVLAAEFTNPELAVADSIVAAAPTAKAKDVAAAAVSLVRAEALIDSKPDVAVELIDAHGRLLLATERGRRLRETGTNRLEQAHRVQARETLERARSALTSGEIRGAVDLVTNAFLWTIPDDLRDQARALRADIERASEREQRSLRLAALTREPVPFRALELVDAMIAEATDGERRGLQERRRSLLDRIGAAYSRRVDTTPRPLGPAPEIGSQDPTEPWPLLLDDGRCAVIVLTRADRVFVLKVDLLDRVTVARVTLRTPEFFDLLGCALRGGSLSFASTDGEIFELSIDTWDIVSRKKLAFAKSSHNKSAREIEVEQRYGVIGRSGFYAGRSSLVWVLDRGLSERRFSAWDTARSMRSLDLACDGDMVFARPIWDLREPAVCVTSYSNGSSSLTIYDAQGRRKLSPTTRIQNDTTWAHPDGESIVYLPSDATDPTWEAWIPSQGSRRLAGLEVPSNVETAFAAQDRRSEQTWLIIHTKEKQRHLLGLKATADGDVDVVERARVPRRTGLLQSASGGVLAMSNGPDGLTAATMDRAAAVLSGLRDPVSPRYRAAFGLMENCHRACGAFGDEVAELVRWLNERHHRDHEIRTRVQRCRQSHDGHELLVLTEGLHRIGRLDLAGDLVPHVLAVQPNHPAARFAYSRAMAQMGQWSALLELLSDIDMEAIPPGYRRHVHHLLGAAHLQLGHADDAIRALEQGEQCDGTCDLEWLMAIALPVGAGEERKWTPENGALREVIASIGAADEALARGEPLAAIAILDDHMAWDLAEVQCLARLAEACLHFEPGDRHIDAFRAGLMVATYRDRHSIQSLVRRRDLPIAGRWNMERLDALDARAAAWLEGWLG